MNTVIAPYPYCQIFEDAARVFAQYDGDDTLYFGLAPWLPVDVRELKKQSRGKFIAYQSDPLSERNQAFANPTYIDMLKLCDEVWDYSEHNLPYLRSHGVVNVKYVPVLPSPILKESPLDKDIDILHVGGLTPHRLLYLNELLGLGYGVFDVVTRYNMAVHHDEMRRLYRRSKVVLGLHGWGWNQIQESFRYQYPLSNDITVLAEKSLSNPLNLEEFSNIDELETLLRKYVQPRPHDENWYMDNYIFAYPVSADDVDAMSQKDAPTCRECVDWMLSDARMVMQLRRGSRRRGETTVVNAHLFRDLIFILRIVMVNHVGFSDAQEKEMRKKLREIYTLLEKKPLRGLLLSTGGRFWPRLRCAMQLSGWHVLCATMRLFLRCHAGDKYVTRGMVLPKWEDCEGRG